MQLSRRCYHRRIVRMSGEAAAAAASNNRLIAHGTRVVGRRDTESRPYFAMPYRPRQQRANPFSLMNHETRQRHRNTLKGEMPARLLLLRPITPPRPYPSSAQPFSHPSIFVLYHSSSPPRPSSLNHDALTLQHTCTCSGKRELS